jgi:hypothetical protein
MTETHVLAPYAVRSYVLAGKSLFTVLNTETGNRYTFKVTQKENADGSKSPHFVSVLTGPENTTHYSYIGCIFEGRTYRWTAKSRLSRDAKAVKVFEWFFRNADRLPGMVEVRHHNRCGKCARVLTVPQSIDTGLGPICAAALGVEWTTTKAA